MMVNIIMDVTCQMMGMMGDSGYLAVRDWGQIKIEMGAKGMVSFH